MISGPASDASACALGCRNTDHAVEDVRPALEATLQDLHTSYLDLYLVRAKLLLTWHMPLCRLLPLLLRCHARIRLRGSPARCCRSARC